MFTFTFIQYTVLLSSRTVLVFEDPQGPIYKSLSLSSDCKSLSLDHKVLENCQGLCISKQSIMYDHVKSINSVTATVHDVMVKNGLLTDFSHYLITDIPYTSK